MILFALLCPTLEAYSEEPCQTYKIGFYLLTICAKRFIHKTKYRLIIQFKSFILFLFL